MQTALLEVWLAITILYFAAGFLILVANYLRLDDPQPRRRVGVASLAVFAILVVHNFFMRNWTSWVGSTLPAFFSEAGFVVETLLLLFIPLTLAYCDLTEGPQERGKSATGRLIPSECGPQSGLCQRMTGKSEVILSARMRSIYRRPQPRSGA